MRRNRASEINTYMLHAVGGSKTALEANKRDKAPEDIHLKSWKGETENNKNAPEETRGDYQTARVAYANCPCAVFGFLGATADGAGADATALAGLTRIGPDPWLWP